MTASPDPGQPEATPADPTLVRVTSLELSKFRRLRAVRLDLDAKTTVIVGANNSGKTSLMTGITRFLAPRNASFSAYDLSADAWDPLLKLGQEWEGESPSAPEKDGTARTEARARQLKVLLDHMPTLDVWFSASDGAWHHVRDLIPTLDWAGGEVGLRLRLEPVSTLKELDLLVAEYLTARRRVASSSGASGAEVKPKTGGETAARRPSRAWPTDLFDFLEESPEWLKSIVGYRLDPSKKQDPDADAQAQPQTLPSPARPLENVQQLLRNLLHVDLVPAQRGLGTEEAQAGDSSVRKIEGMLSHQVVEYAKRLLERVDDTDARAAERQAAVADVLDRVHGSLDDALNKALAPQLDSLKKMGFPGVKNLAQLDLRTRVQPHELLRHRAAVQYRTDGAAEGSPTLPEHAIGLGYQNLLALTFRMMELRDARMRNADPEKDRGDAAPKARPPTPPPPAHLVLLEEPEAHLHVQVQRTFIERAHERICVDGRPELSSQLLVSTHSSHLAHAVDFAQLRYARRRSAEPGPLPTSVIVSLKTVFSQPGKGGADTPDKLEEDTLRFVQRYLRVQHNDLLFADAVILVEGTAERVLLPAFIERDHEGLANKYLSILEVGGSHAHRLRPLLELLRLPTLVITDLDPVAPAETKDGKKTWRKAPVQMNADQITANPTLKHWLPARQGIDELVTVVAAAEKRPARTDGFGAIGVAYQVPAVEGGPCGSSLEDSLVLENLDWFAGLPANVDGPLLAMHTQASELKGDIASRLHEKLAKNFDKGEFALDVFLRLDQRFGGQTLQCPRYIREGLEWLAAELDRVQAMGVS
jgi:predicted ATP-dependent endonuclease of OLD family